MKELQHVYVMQMPLVDPTNFRSDILNGDKIEHGRLPEKREMKRPYRYIKTAEWCIMVTSDTSNEIGITETVYLGLVAAESLNASIPDWKEPARSMFALMGANGRLVKLPDDDDTSDSDEKATLQMIHDACHQCRNNSGECQWPDSLRETVVPTGYFVLDEGQTFVVLAVRIKPERVVEIYVFTWGQRRLVEYYCSHG